VQASSFGATFGGGEANVAASLAAFGIDAAFVTKLPANEIGDAALNYLRRFGVDVSQIVRGGNRLGIYFLEKGASQRPSKVIYDRKNSAIAEAERGDFNWQNIFSGAQWFHFTGITPALSDGAASICMDAAKAAKDADLAVSCDLNYRKNLWNRDKAEKIMSPLLELVDVCFANEEDAAQVFGIKARNSDVETGSLYREGYLEVAQTLAKRFNLKWAGITLRESVSASDNNWAGMLYEAEGDSAYFSKTYPVHIVDRVGAGDSFAAGIIYGILNNLPPQDAVEFAAAASCLKHSIEGDFNMANIDEIKKLAAGDSSGRVQR
jgi:2-dehydro-3-deoxygluconokinase